MSNTDLGTEVELGVAILRRKNYYEEWGYQLHCMRCHQGVYGARTGTWTTKAGATKVAKEHMARHAHGEDYLARITQDGRYEHVGMVIA